MYLVHIAITSPAGTSLPTEIKQMVEAVAPSVLEHVVIHPGAHPHPVISLFLRAPSLDEAEMLAKQIWEHTAASSPQLDKWSLIRAEVPLFPYDLE